MARALTTSLFAPFVAHDRLGCVLGGTVSGLLLSIAALDPTGDDLGPLAFGALVPLLAAILAPGARLRAVALGGWLCGVSFFGSGYLWSLQVRGEVTVPLLVYVAGIGVLASCLAGFAIGLAWVGRRFGRGLALGLAPGAWILIELARASGPLGMPWLQLGSLLAGWPLLIQSADLGGVHGLSAWVVAVNAAVVGAAGLAGPWRVAFPSLLWLAPVLYGLAILPGLSDRGQGAPLRITAIQPHLAEEERHVAERFDANLRVLLDLSEATGATDLIVWPETAYERRFGAEGDPFLGAIAHSLGVPLLTGVRRTVSGSEFTIYNSAVLATPDGRAVAVADKVRPVPVYERAPGGPLGWLLASAGLWPGRVEPGGSPGLVGLVDSTGREIPLGILICFDASHPEVARQLRRSGAQLIVGLYNEAQSGSWVARQHELFARLRAVENRIPTVRVANTGRSTWIDAGGRVVAALAAGSRDAGTAALRPTRGQPLYSRVGDTPVFAVVLGGPLLAGLVLAWLPSLQRFRGFRGGTGPPGVSRLPVS